MELPSSEDEFDEDFHSSDGDAMDVDDDEEQEKTKKKKK
jgi:hypothetical protein